MNIMTVTIAAKHEISKTDDNDNETCYKDKERDHTGSLLKNLIKESIPENNNVKQEKKTETAKEVTRPEKRKKVFSYKEAPDFIKHNVYILSGYRGVLNTRSCIQSIFWWTNETVNIWSHIFGFFLFSAAAVRDLLILEVEAEVIDRVIVAFVLACFIVCMFFSALYHTFCCRSAHDCNKFLSYDLFGIALSLLAIYASGIYYAFWCDPPLCRFYLFTVTVIFMIAMLLHIPRFDMHPKLKMFVFVGWAIYGVVPTVHWCQHMGWFDNTLVMVLVPRVAMMYVISAAAFFIYLTKIPEKFWPGKVDYLGHSHQWWHLLVVLALYYWHGTGMVYLEYRFNHVCAIRPTLI